MENAVPLTSKLFAFNQLRAYQRNESSFHGGIETFSSKLNEIELFYFQLANKNNYKFKIIVHRLMWLVQEIAWIYRRSNESKMNVFNSIIFQMNWKCWKFHHLYVYRKIKHTIFVYCKEYLNVINIFNEVDIPYLAIHLRLKSVSCFVKCVSLNCISELLI